MKKRDIKESIPLVILLVLGLISIIQISITKYIFTYQQYIGLTILAIVTFLFFFHRRSYKYLMGIMLILSTFSFIAFTAAIFTIQFLGLPIQIIPFLVLMIYSFIYRHEISNIIHRWTRQPEQEKEINQANLKNDFKTRFKKLSDSQIENRLKEKGLAPEAKEALNELKEERKHVL